MKFLAYIYVVNLIFLFQHLSFSLVRMVRLCIRAFAHCLTWFTRNGSLSWISKLLLRKLWLHRCRIPVYNLMRHLIFICNSLYYSSWVKDLTNQIHLKLSSKLDPWSTLGKIRWLKSNPNKTDSEWVSCQVSPCHLSISNGSWTNFV